MTFVEALLCTCVYSRFVRCLWLEEDFELLSIVLSKLFGYVALLRCLLGFGAFNYITFIGHSNGFESYLLAFSKPLQGLDAPVPRCFAAVLSTATVTFDLFPDCRSLRLLCLGMPAGNLLGTPQNRHLTTLTSAHGLRRSRLSFSITV